LCGARLRQCLLTLSFHSLAPSLQKAFKAYCKLESVKDQHSLCKQLEIF
jgi:hypothetical protein